MLPETTGLTHQQRNAIRGQEQHIFNLVWENATPDQWSAWLTPPLEHAAAAGDLGVVKGLLRAGADVGGREELVCDLLLSTSSASSPTTPKRGYSDTTLHVAAALNDHAVEVLLARGADPNAVDNEGRTPLRIAVEHGRLASVRALLAAGADVGARFEADDCAALDLAAGEGGRADMLREVIRHSADVNVAGCRGLTALHRAAFHDQAGAVDLLVEAGANLEATDAVGWAPLHDACAEGSSGAMAALLRHGADSGRLDKKGRAPLHLAAERGHLLAVRALVATGANVGLRYGSNECSPLDVAAVSGHVRVVKAIVPHVSDINAAASDGRTALHRAAFFNQAGVIDALVRAGADVDACDSECHWTPLHDASSQCSSDAVAVLVAHGANINVMDKEGRAPLHLITEGGHAPAARALLAAGADCGLRYGDSELSVLDLAVREAHLELMQEVMKHVDVNDAGSLGYTALHHAAFWDEAAVIDSLVEAGADSEARDIDGRTPLHAAALKGSSEAVVALVRHGVELNALDGEGRAPLHLAAEYGHIYAAEALLAAGVDCTLRVDAGGGNEWSALDLAAGEGHARIVREFMRRGADANASDSQGNTALHRAAFTNKAAAIDALAEAGADVEATDVAGWTPLHDAAAEGSSDAVLALTRNGANPNRLDLEGRSPLHLAAEHGHLQAVEHLLAAGAEAGVRFGNSECSALDFAAVGGHLDVLGVIVRRGVDVNATDSGGRTALHRAAFFNQAGAIEIIVEAGGCVTQEDGVGRTSFGVATARGSTEAAAALELHGGNAVVPDAASACESQVRLDVLQAAGADNAADDSTFPWGDAGRACKVDAAVSLVGGDEATLGGHFHDADSDPSSIGLGRMLERLASERAGGIWPRKDLLALCLAHPGWMRLRLTGRKCCGGKMSPGMADTGSVLAQIGMAGAEAGRPDGGGCCAKARLSPQRVDSTGDERRAAGLVLELEEDSLLRKIVAFL